MSADAMSAQPRVNLLGLTRQQLESFFAGMGEKPFRATQVMKWIFQEGIDDFAAMTNLSKALRERLQEVAEIRLPEVMQDHPSADGTRKWLLKVDAHNHIEMVYIPETDRSTLCVSSQVGCTLACRFCSTARQGFNRNLTTAEIIGQVALAARIIGLPENKGERVITNVVLMGMGEPLLNLEHVAPALELMQDDLAFGISKRRVTVSTAGVVPGIDRLCELSDVSLAVSLHATDDALRDQLMPLNTKYPIKELMAACQRYVAGKPHRRVTFEYVMLAGVNDSLAQARQLARLLRTVPAKVNLIPFNPFPGAPYACSSPAVINAFREVIMQAGIMTVTRKTRGEDIAAACGQLAGQVTDRTRRSERFLLQDLPGGGSGASSGSRAAHTIKEHVTQ
ncbi:MAG: 23S rRNA (adenine(2503)-C(2))-methyltransferase RlmN [Gammaproteobacteria bacterium]|nr:23S rRNA (adenine(2503)-C(2))-methyltransferase RlmN [Gammaproteobacteria bacterium]